MGYLLRDEYRLPPLMFNSDELKALALGAMMVQAWSDHELASVTKTAIRKIESILPEKLRKEIELEQIVVPNFQLAEATSDNLAGIRHAIDEQMKLSITYHSLKGDQTNRTIWPFLLYFWKQVDPAPGVVVTGIPLFTSILFRVQKWPMPFQQIQSGLCRRMLTTSGTRIGAVLVSV